MPRQANRFGGGANTNRNGLHFEQTTSLNTALQNAGFIIANHFEVYDRNQLLGYSINQDEFNIFSFDGLIKSFITINLFNLIFSYALRFVIIKVFILITPFSILSLINNSTSWFFKTWFKTIFSLLLQQSFISIILLIIFSFNYSSNDTISKLMYIGGIYALVRANSYMQHLIGGISTDISNNFNISNKLFKNI